MRGADGTGAEDRRGGGDAGGGEPRQGGGGPDDVGDGVEGPHLVEGDAREGDAVQV